jgi:nitroreductase
MLALEAYSLSSCPINWPEINVKNKELNKIIGLDPYEKCVMCLAVGYAQKDQIIPLSIRKTTDDLIIFNRFK